MAQVVFSSWKEVASYLGKGVRTVQRWERELGLPIRRPRRDSGCIILAFAEDIDRWLQSIPPTPRTTQAQTSELRNQMALLERENERLRTELNRLRHRLGNEH